MNAEVTQVINFLLDRHTEKDSLIKSLGDELDNIKREQKTSTANLTPPPEPLP